MKLKFLTILILPYLAIAQEKQCNNEIFGVVYDLEGVKLSGATISIPSIFLSTSTNALGEFAITKLCAGEYVVYITYIGYKELVIDVTLPLKEGLKLILEEDLIFLEDVKIEGIKSEGSLQSRSILTERDFDLVQGKSLGESLKKLPGLSTLQTGPAIFKPVIHGLHSQRILILNNGIRQEGQQWGPEHAPEIDPFIANEIQVIKGAEAIRYGADAMGGVIIIDTPPLHQTEGIGGEINLLGMSNSRMGVISAMLEGDFGGSETWAWRIQGTKKNAGDFRAANYYLSNTGIDEANMSAALGFRTKEYGAELYLSSYNAEIGILRSAHTGSLSDLNQAINNDRPWYIRPFSYDINNPRQKVGHHLLKLNSYKYFGENKLDIQYGAQLNERKEFDIRRGDRNDIPALSMQLFTQTLDASIGHRTKFSDGSIGTNFTYKINRNIPGTGIRPLLPDYEQFNAGIFLIEHFESGEWKYELGLRYDHQQLLVKTFTSNNELVKPNFAFNYFTGAVGAHRKISNRTVFNTHLGLSARPPHVSELYSEGLHHGTAAIEEGLMRINGELNTDETSIKNEQSLKWINTLHFANKNLSTELSAYINYFDNYIYLRPATTRLTIRGAFPVFQYTQTNALLAGIDYTINTNIGKYFNYTGKFSYLYGKDLSNDDVLIYLPPIQFENAITYNIPSEGKISDIFFTISLPTNLRQYRAPIVVPPSEVRDYEGSAIFDFAAAPEAFTLLNIESGFKFYVGKKLLSVMLIAENVTNESYRVYMNRLRYFADDVGRNFIVKLKYDFHAHD
jgi:iron complex outermembrane recepter protein